MASLWAFLVLGLAVGSLARHRCTNSSLCLDCHTLQVCSPHSLSWENATVVNCSQTSRPYCDPAAGVCSATPSATCAPPDTFSCFSDGYFPDPSDCRSFHLCVDLVPTAYQCDPSLPSNYGYDPVLHRCVANPTCGFGCAGKSGVKVSHPVDKNLFAFCYNGSVVFQDRCPGNYRLDEDSQECQAVCEAQELLVDVERCDMFFRCISQNGGFLRRHERCPQGQGFNPITFTCEENLLSCNTSLNL